MKLTYSGLFIISLWCFSILACTKNDSVILGPGEYTLKLGALIEMKDDVQIQLFNIEDSRCPKSVTCVWEGEAKTYFVASSNQVSDTLKLTYSGACESENANCADTASFLNYRIILQSVLPYPTDEDPIPLSDYEVKLKIEEE